MSDLLDLELEGWGSDEPAPPPGYMAALNAVTRRLRESQRILAGVRVTLEPFRHVPMPQHDEPSGSFAHQPDPTEDLDRQE